MHLLPLPGTAHSQAGGSTEGRPAHPTDPCKLEARPAAGLRVDGPAVGRAWGQVFALRHSGTALAEEQEKQDRANTSGLDRAEHPTGWHCGDTGCPGMWCRLPSTTAQRCLHALGLPHGRAAHPPLRRAPQLTQGGIAKGEERAVCCQGHGVVKPAGHLQGCRPTQDRRADWACLAVQTGDTGAGAGRSRLRRRPAGMGTGECFGHFLKKVKGVLYQQRPGALWPAHLATHTLRSGSRRKRRRPPRLRDAHPPQRLHTPRLPAAALCQPPLLLILGCTGQALPSFPALPGSFLLAYQQRAHTQLSAAQGGRTGQRCAGRNSLNRQEGQRGALPHLTPRRCAPGDRWRANPRSTGCHPLQQGDDAQHACLGGGIRRRQRSF